MNQHELERLHRPSQLFSLRLWREPAESAQLAQAGELRMQVKHLLSGETRYFRDWQALIVYLETNLDQQGQSIHSISAKER